MHQHLLRLLCKRLDAVCYNNRWGADHRRQQSYTIALLVCVNYIDATYAPARPAVQASGRRMLLQQVACCASV
jgi:hypothetical protein